MRYVPHATQFRDAIFCLPMYLSTRLPTTKVDASVCHNYTAFSYYFYGGYLCQKQAGVAGRYGPNG